MLTVSQKKGKVVYYCGTVSEEDRVILVNIFQMLPQHNKKLPHTLLIYQD